MSDKLLRTHAWHCKRKMTYIFLKLRKGEKISGKRFVPGLLNIDNLNLSFITDLFVSNVEADIFLIWKLFHGMHLILVKAWNHVPGNPSRQMRGYAANAWGMRLRVKCYEITLSLPSL